MTKEVVKILEIGNIVVEKVPLNYMVSELIVSKKGKREGELVQSNRSYHPGLKRALVEVNERLRAKGIVNTELTDIAALIEAIDASDELMEMCIDDAVEALERKG